MHRLDEAADSSVPNHAPVAQLDRVSVSEAEGHRFNSCQARHFLLYFLLGFSSPLFASDWKDPDYIQQSFAKIALKSEYVSHKPQLRKWRSAIYYQFQHDVGDQTLHEQLSNAHLQQLSGITGHPIEPATKRQPANLQIFFTNESRLAAYLGKASNLDDQAIEKHNSNSVCFANFTVNSQGEIVQATVVIPVDRARAHAKLLACIVEELTQIMGLPNDDVTVFPSVFNDHSHDSFLSGLDYILLKLLYQAELSPGMNARQSHNAISKMMQQPRFQKWLDEADTAVRASGLYPLMD